VRSPSFLWARLFAAGVLLAGSAIAGDFTARYQLTLHRVLAGTSPRFSDAFLLADIDTLAGRRFTNFSGDVSGRFLGAVASAAAYSAEVRPELDRIAARVVALQRPDGHFGADFSRDGAVTTSDMALLWGNGRMLIGLMEYYRLNQRPETLAAARRLGDFLVRVAPRLNDEAVRRDYNGPKFAVGYICWTQNLEGLAALYRETKDDRYLALARELADRVDRHQSQHSHGYLTSVRGLVALYRVTGEARYLDQAQDEWKGVIDSGNLLLPGTVPEMFAPMMKRDEGCSEADWLRLSLDLWETTRNPAYLERAETALFNEFEFNQFATGDFGHHTLTDTGVMAPTARAWWCCTFHGLRAMIEVFRNVFHQQDRGLRYDLPVDGRGQIVGLSVKAASSLERDASVRLTVIRADGSSHELAVRVPAWASQATLSVNGEPVDGEGRNGYRSIARAWKAGDQVTVAYTLKTRVVRDSQGANRAAVFHGPWLLAADEETSLHYFDEPSASNEVKLPATPAASGRTPAATLQARYLPGGYPVQPATVVLRPMSEYRWGAASGRLDYWLPLAPTQEELDSNYKAK
jgi:DUF1680 family protein